MDEESEGIVRRIFRYEVPVDDAEHVIELTGEVVGVGARTPYAMEFWAVSTDDFGEPEARRFLVVGTGQPIPSGRVAFHGHAVVAGGTLVWHLVELFKPRGKS